MSKKQNTKAELPTIQDRIDSLMPDPRETARSIHDQAVKLQRQGKTYAAAKSEQSQPQAEHSPLPWSACCDGCADVEDNNGELVSKGFYAPRSLAEAQGNAKLIVASVNQAQALAEVAQSVIDEAKDGLDRSAWRLQAARKALANWEGAK